MCCRLWSQNLQRETDFIDNFGYRIKPFKSYDVTAEHEAKLSGDVEVSSTTLASGQYLPGTGFKLRNFARLIDHIAVDFWMLLSFKPLTYLNPLADLDHYKNDQLPFTGLTFTDRDVARWNMAWRAVQRCKLVEDTVKNRVKRPGVKSLPGLLTERCKDWPDYGSVLEDLLIAFGFSATAFIYGGLHALAWSARFNSNTEQLLWRVSVCIVMGGFPVACIVSFVGNATDDAREKIQGSSGQKGWVQRATGFVADILMALELFLIVLLFSIAPAYILARAYLVVECFITLSHLPAGAYDVPVWSAYFPHIS